LRGALVHQRLQAQGRAAKRSGSEQGESYRPSKGLRCPRIADIRGRLTGTVVLEVVLGGDSPEVDHIFACLLFPVQADLGIGEECGHFIGALSGLAALLVREVECDRGVKFDHDEGGRCFALMP